MTETPADRPMTDDECQKLAVALFPSMITALADQLAALVEGWDGAPGLTVGELIDLARGAKR